VVAGSDHVCLRQRTGGTAIDLGGADAPGVLGLTDAELDRVTFAGIGTIDIGDGSAGTITISQAITRGAPTLMNLTTGGNTNFGPGGRLIAPSAAVTLNAPSGSITTPPGSSATAPDVRAALVTADGVVAPGGASPGEFAVDGGFAFNSSGDTYRVQLNGGAP